MTNKELVELAIKAMERSYSPYSDFKVGAALLCEDESVFLGCNIENASFSPTCCAERTAFFKAISEGKLKFKAIAVVGGKNGDLNDYCYPCGVCRQVMREFCDDSFRILFYKENGKIKEHTLGEILPFSFGL